MHAEDDVALHNDRQRDTLDVYTFHGAVAASRNAEMGGAKNTTDPNGAGARIQATSAQWDRTGARTDDVCFVPPPMRGVPRADYFEQVDDALVDLLRRWQPPDS
jgi:hypothetical protein